MRREEPSFRLLSKAASLPRSLVTVVAAALLSGAVVSACGGAAKALTSSKATTTSPPVSTSTTAQAITTPTVQINGSTYNVPTETGTTPIDPLQATGQNVVFTPTGFLPRTLYSSLNTPIIYTNLSCLR